MIGLGFIILALLSLGLLAGTDGNAFLALLPQILTLVAVALWRLPMRPIAHGLLFLALVVDNTTERPGHNLYKSFSYNIGALLYEPLSKTIHLSGWKLTGLETIFTILILIVLLRITTGSRIDSQATDKGYRHLPAPVGIMQSCLVSIAVLLWLFSYGVITAGSFPHALFQMRTMLFVPLMTMFFAYTFKDDWDGVMLLNTLIAVGVIRAMMCIYYYVTVVQKSLAVGTSSGDGSYVTTHSDSILAAVVIVIFLVNLYAKPSMLAIGLCLTAVPLVGLGILLNNRRIAFVSVFLGLLFSYVAASYGFKQRMRRTVWYMMPLILVYTIVGWQSNAGWAKPVKTLRSVFMQKDTSSATRDIENYNLLQTLKVHPLAGFGYGHMYIERVHAFDISKIFEEYRYVPHNSVLWFLGVGGYIGYTLYWSYFICGIFSAARLLRFATSHTQALVAMTAISAGISYLSQCYGDMGLMSWMGGLIVSASFGLSCNLAFRCGGLAMNSPVDSALGYKVLR